MAFVLNDKDGNRKEMLQDGQPYDLALPLLIALHNFSARAEAGDKEAAAKLRAETEPLIERVKKKYGDFGLDDPFTVTNENS